jgi:hypothetical protein
VVGTHVVGQPCVVEGLVRAHGALRVVLDVGIELRLGIGDNM